VPHSNLFETIGTIFAEPPPRRRANEFAAGSLSLSHLRHLLPAAHSLAGLSYCHPPTRTPAYPATTSCLLARRPTLLPAAHSLAGLSYYHQLPTRSPACPTTSPLLARRPVLLPPVAHSLGQVISAREGETERVSESWQDYRQANGCGCKRQRSACGTRSWKTARSVPTPRAN
jgi:hypothetical protein